MDSHPRIIPALKDLWRSILQYALLTQVPSADEGLYAVYRWSQQPLVPTDTCMSAQLLLTFLGRDHSMALLKTWVLSAMPKAWDLALRALLSL
jgi:hypothetical protein